MRRDSCLPYLSLQIDLHGCVEEDNIKEFIDNLENYIKQQQMPDFNSDVDIFIYESVGMTEKMQSKIVGGKILYNK